MRTDLPEALLATDAGGRADEILRSCVHCGFCNATCPTYQLLGDELDGPRGRIYLIKDMLETGTADAVVQTHLDRCLTCRACETTCPSGVRYGELLEIGRDHLASLGRRRAAERFVRAWLLRVVPHRRRLRRWLRLGRAFRWLLPSGLAGRIPPLPRRRPVSEVAADRRVVVLDGCVQSVSTPGVNEALSRLLGARGIRVETAPGEGCCGALALHLGESARAQAAMQANARALADAADGAEAILSTASGCGVTVKDYGRLLPEDPAAERVAGLTLDAAEFLHGLDTTWSRAGEHRRVAWQAPCTLQRGQRAAGRVEDLLRRAGYELVPVAEPHLCCGSAGTYSMLQPALSGQLKRRKLDHLEAAAPDVIATANVGCQLHLATESRVPVVHWLELLK
ncbi:MAG: glycolate oxidase iron-sulfur subunit [Gammaproteobacteria bacterium]|nr:glycolate oxidase iron-sulfur subunit [Gammaproteobacteria bacterium]MBK79344.1 glycolate oxidase iron-sulfur subunit [Gammaproteobacteria bacterium]